MIKKKKKKKTRQNEMAEHVWLPDPTKIVLTDFSCVLDIIVWPSYRIDRMTNKLIDACYPVDAFEASKASITHQVRDIRHSK